MVISSLTYRRVCNKSNMTGATSGEGTAYPSLQPFFVLQLLITRFFLNVMNDHNLTSSYPEKRLITYPSTRLRGRCAAYSDLIYCYRLSPDTNVYSIQAYLTLLVLLYVNYYTYA
jgi:hypothetical protein